MGVTQSEESLADDFARWVRHNGTIATLGSSGTDPTNLLRAAFLAGLSGEVRPRTGLGPVSLPEYDPHICRECHGGDPERIFPAEACERCSRTPETYPGSRVDRAS